MKKLLILFLITLLTCACALAEDTSIVTAPDVMRPGKTERISFTAQADGTATLELVDPEGVQVAVLRQDIHAAAGENHLTWDGTDENEQSIAQGSYSLRLTLATDSGVQEAFYPVTLGNPAPEVTHIQAPGVLVANENWSILVDCSMTGTLDARIKLSDGEWHTIASIDAVEGTNTLTWDGKMDGAWVPSGDYAVQVRLTDASGFTGTPQQIALILSDMPTPTPVPTATPQPTPYLPSQVTTQEEETSYWTLPIGEMDEAAIWEVMMQPITVLDGAQKETFKIRSTPDDSSRENIIGEITYASQGVHVLEHTDDGWTLVEVYNSSYGPDCDSRRGYGITDDLLTGYVKTSLLKEITPREDYALLVDKLYQVMYIFSEGKIIGELSISTGEPTKSQPWNETPAGEFLMVSRVGGFPAGNLWCAYGMRINGGCIIHEVPYIGNADTPSSDRDYSSTVPKLGSKASHGCVRVQKAKNQEGHNIKWLWDNIRVNTKVLIWDDTHRILPYPDGNTPVYYNPEGGQYFHEEQNCASVREKFLPLTETTYSELPNLFKKVKRCPSCATLKTTEEIDQINQANNPDLYW